MVLKYVYNIFINVLEKSYHLSQSAIKMRLKRSKQKKQSCFTRQTLNPGFLETARKGAVLILMLKGLLGWSSGSKTIKGSH